MLYSKNIFIAILLFIYSSAAGQLISTIAGNGTAGYTGNGGPAYYAELNSPQHAVPDNSGNLYIADVSNNCIRKVNAAGIINTIAGNGSAMHSGDGSNAIKAGINKPTSIAIDKFGNLYIAEENLPSEGSWIRKVDTSGIITTIAGNGTYGYSGDGAQATTAEFQYVTDLAVDTSGNIYIADQNNNRIRKINTAGIITTIAGNGTYGYSGDGGPATAAQLNTPKGLALDRAGNIYIADYLNARIRIVNTAGTISTIAGNGTWGYSGDKGPATAAKLNGPAGVAIDTSGYIYIADSHNACIRKVNAAGVITTIAGNSTTGNSGDGGIATKAQLNIVFGVSVDRLDNIYIPDMGNNNVRKVTGDTVLIIPELKNEHYSLQIWPEPNEGTFTIYMPAPASEPAQVIITNLVGQKIKEIIATTNKEIQIQLDAPPGIYFVTTITEEGKQSKKVVVQ